MEESRPAVTAPAVTAFICANCARPGQAPSSAGQPRPTLPNFNWPFPVQEVLVPCTGRIQPEHVLKAFEFGADVVCTIACQEDNCHYLEGSKRCARRVDYLRSILDEVGLGGRRMMIFHLPGTAAEDQALAVGKAVAACTYEAEDARLAAIRDGLIEALSGLAANPMLTAPAAVAAGGPYQEVDTRNDDNEK
jgi:coenzyme F420-reducing hydrogenase delta subunit